MKNFNLPGDYRPYIDKYFLRSKEILEKEELNPRVKAQIFIRKGNCKVYGIDEAIAILTKYSDIQKTGKVWALNEGDYFKDKEILMIIEAPIQSIIDLETMYLGVLSAETSHHNDNTHIDYRSVQEKMKSIVDLVDDRPVSYFGARHWHYSQDSTIARLCMLAGAENCSTDIGAKNWDFNSKGIGTIPHSLETIYHWKYGINRAVVEATKAFDRHINPMIPRIALVDYANREISDILMVYNEIKNLTGIRIDTCGENFMESIPKQLCTIDNTGVSLEGVIRLHNILAKEKIRNKIKIILSSGFGNIEKVKSFVEYENNNNVKLFDGLGVGGVFESRMATMDIIRVENQEIHKVGRNPRENSRLRRVI